MEVLLEKAKDSEFEKSGYGWVLFWWLAALISNVGTYRKCIDLYFLLFYLVNIRFAVLPEKAKNGKFERFLVLWVVNLVAIFKV